MKLSIAEEEIVKKIVKHMNENHLGEDGESENEWTKDDVIRVAFMEGLERIAKRHHIK